MGVQILDELSSSLGTDICRDHLLYEFISLQDDPVFQIRKEVVTRLVRISNMLGVQIFNGVIIPVFRKLSQDQIWAVRKACVEVLPDISKISNAETKNS